MARAASAGSAPISPSNWPLRAGAVEPPTGHSTSAAPLARTLGASSVSTLGATVLISMNSLPLTSPDSSPFGPLYTASIAAPSVSMVMTASLARGDGGRRGGDLGAGVGQRLGLFRRAIPDGHLVADFHQPRGDVAAHGAETGYSDMHDVLPRCFCRRR